MQTQYGIELTGEDRDEQKRKRWNGQDWNERILALGSCWTSSPPACGGKNTVSTDYAMLTEVKCIMIEESEKQVSAVPANIESWAAVCTRLEILRKITLLQMREKTRAKERPV